MILLSLDMHKPRARARNVHPSRKKIHCTNESSRKARTRKLEIIFCVCCTCGFIYQATTFILHYLTYPTVLDLQIDEPLDVAIPALTLCNRNHYRRTQLCEMFPEKCRKLKEKAICSSNPVYCKEKNHSMYLMFPKSNIGFKLQNSSREDLFLLGHQLFPLINRCLIMSNESILCQNSSFQWSQVKAANNLVINCFTFYPKETNSLLPTTFSRTSGLMIEVQFEPEEYTNPWEDVEIYASLHDPEELGNPFKDGFTLKPLNVYHIRVSQVTRKLLPPPYSNCNQFSPRNEFEKRYRRKLPCDEICKVQESLKECDCIDRKCFFYIKNYSLCVSGHSCLNPMYIHDCSKRCEKPCQSSRYETKILEIAAPKKINQMEKQDNRPSLSVLFLWFGEFTITEYSYTPKYEPVELFGYLGGYVGIWLGISLITVYGFLESSLRSGFKILWNKRKLSQMKKTALKKF